MQRRDFLTQLLAAGAVSQLPAQTSGITFERPVPGTPHKGKVLAAIQPHSDDVPIYCSGTVAKLLQEGYTGYMIRATNDDMGDDVGEPGTIGENVLRNEREVTEQARALGLEREWIGNKVRAISFLFTPDGASTGTGKETSDVTTTPV